VAAVVVNYNAGAVLLDCVRSLRAEGVDEVVVVDNASTDGSLAALRASDPAAVVVETGANLGYGAAANRGVAASSADLVLVMNPDTTVEPGTIKALVAALEADPRLAIVGPRIENSDGSVYPSVRTFPALGDALGHAFLHPFAPRNRFSRRYRMLDWDHGAPAEVDWVAGTCLLVRRSVFDQLGGFDERYFMYVEDVDLCWRAGQAGWRVGYEPAGRVGHLIGVSSDQAPYRMILEHHRSLYRFAAVSLRGRRRLLLPLVAIGLGVRVLLVWAARLVRRQPPAAHQ
jgi:N-acetylglucosaminyl-diphospho-decaprenol L-rhamnosyltransferase